MNNSEFIPAKPLNIAVLFLVFNRLDTTKKVFEAIKKAKPPRLYVAADGARETKDGEDKKVKEVRDYVIDKIDWKCEVKTLFREHNLGCKYAVSGGIDWFFENEEMGIILEDDCLPSISFFRFCEELLIKYKDDTRIGLISGDNFQNGNIRGDSSYYFSRYIHIWGWATWRRAWKKYDINMDSFPVFLKEKSIKSIITDKKEQMGWLDIFNKIYNNEIDTWDYQWVYTCFSNSSMSIMPNKNLVTNIGFGGEGTHTMDRMDPAANMKVDDLIFPLVDPKFKLINKVADDYSKKTLFTKKSIFIRIINKILKIASRKKIRLY